MLAESKSQAWSLWTRSWYVNNPKIVEFEGNSGEHLDFFMLQKQKSPPSIVENLIKGAGKDYSFTCFACQIHLINFQNTLKHCKVFIKDYSHLILFVLNQLLFITLAPKPFEERDGENRSWRRRFFQRNERQNEDRDWNEASDYKGLFSFKTRLRFYRESIYAIRLYL